MRALGPLFAVAVLTGCYDLSTMLIPPPPLGEDPVASLVLAIAAGPLFEVHAARVHAGQLDESALPIKLTRLVPPGTAVRVESLRLPQSLEALGLVEGLNLSSSSTGARPLPSGMPLLQLDADPELAPGPWFEVDVRSPQLSAFRIAVPRGRCPSFDALEVDLPEPMRQPVFAAEVEPGVVWIGAHTAPTDVRVFEVTGSKVEVTRMPSYYRSLFVPSPGVVWLGTYGGKLDRVRTGADLSPEETVSLPSLEGVYWLSGASSTSSVDLFVLTGDGIVEHYDGVTATRVHTFAVRSTERVVGDIAWVGPNEAIVAWPSEPGVTRVRRVDGRWQIIDEPLPGSTGWPSAVAFAGDFGEVVGTGNGQFFGRRGHAWDLLPGSIAGTLVFTIEPYDGGFVYGAAYGHVGLYSTADGFCPPTYVESGIDIRSVAVLRSGALLATGRQTMPRASFTWLRP